MKIKIAIVDDHKIFREGLEHIFKDYDNFEIVLVAESGEKFLFKVAELPKQPDVVIMDVNLPGINGFETCQKLYNHNPQIKVLIMSSFYNIVYIESAIKNRACGYISKNDGTQELVSALESIYNNGFYFNELISHQKLKEFEENGFIKVKFLEHDNITKRELDILKEVCKGLSENEIADKLCISRETVATHKKSLMHKIGVNNVVSLVMFAIKNELHLPNS